MKQVDKIIREYYPTGGPLKCQEFLPDKTQTQISRRANYIGVEMDSKYSGRNKGRQCSWVKNGWDDIIKERYPDGGSVACMPYMPKSTTQISGRAATLGIKMTDEGYKNARAAAARKANKSKAAKSQSKADDIQLDWHSLSPVPPSIYKNRLINEYW